MTGPRSHRIPGPFRFALIVAALIGAAACQTMPAPEPATAAAPIGREAAQGDIDAIRITIDAVNATAGGPVADQQAQLIAHVEPARRDEMQRCPTATTTVRLEPVDQGLRSLPNPPADSPVPSAPPTDPPVSPTPPTHPPGDAEDAATSSSAPATPTADGITYALPTLIRIFSGDRLIGTDLTTLQLVVRIDGGGREAYLTPFCVN